MQTIQINVDSPSSVVIGYIGENNATKLVFNNIPEQYTTGGDLYIDFELPNKNKYETSALVANEFVIPNALLATKGYGRINLLYRSVVTSAVALICEFELNIKYAINSEGKLVTEYANVIQDLQDRMESWESSIANADVATAQASLATQSAVDSKLSEINSKVSEDNAKLSELSALDSKNSAYASETVALDAELGAIESEFITVQAMHDLLAVLGSDVATLVGGKIPMSQIPATATQEIYVITSETQLVELTAQRGDLAELMESINGEDTITKTWQCLDDATIRSNWIVWGTSYAVQAGNATMASEAINSTMINNHRIVEMTAEQFAIAVKDANTYYLVY